MKKYNWKNYNWKKFRRILAVVLALAILAYNMPRFTMTAKADDEEPSSVGEVEKVDIEGLVAFTAGVNEFTFNGQTIKPEVVVTGSEAINPATTEGFSVVYNDDSEGNFYNVGDYSVTVSATDENEAYKGSVTLQYSITALGITAAINSKRLVLSPSSMNYIGRQIDHKTEIKLLLDGVEIPYGSPNYTFRVWSKDGVELPDGSRMEEPGNYEIRISGKGNIVGQKVVSFVLSPINISDEKVKITIDPESPLYTSEIEEPDVLVSYEGNSDIEFREGEDYKVTFAKPFIIGENVITVTPVEGGRLSGKAVNLIWTLRTDGTITGENVYVENNKNGAKWFLNGTTIYYDDTNSEDFRIYGKENYQIGTENEINCEAIFENYRWAIKPNRDLDNQNIEFWLSYFRSGHWNKITLKFIKDSQDPVLTVSQDLDKTYVDGNDVLWTNSLKPVKIKVTDDKSGVKRMVTYIEKGATGEGTPVALDANGEATLTDLVQGTTYTFTAWDNVGHEVTFDYTVAMVDDTKPVIVVFANGTETVWNENQMIFFGSEDLDDNHAIQLQITAIDPETGLSADYAPVDYEFIPADPAEEDHAAVHFVAHNNLGEGIDVYVTFCYDPTVPVLSDYSVTYNQDQSATVSITVNEDHLEKLELVPVDGTLIGVQPNTTLHDPINNVYTWTVTVDDGKYSKGEYFVRATDFSGNVTTTYDIPVFAEHEGGEEGGAEGGEGKEEEFIGEEAPAVLIQPTRIIELDKEKPVISSVGITDATPSQAGWYNANVRFVILGDEGLNHTEDNTVVLKYSKDGGANWSEFINPSETDGINQFKFEVTEADTEFDGTYYFQIVDKAGNASEYKTIDFNKDTTAPYSDDIYVAYKLDPVDDAVSSDQHLFVSSGEGDALYANESIQVQLFVRDNLSGVASVSCEYVVSKRVNGNIVCSTPVKLDDQVNIGGVYYDVFVLNITNETTGTISLNGKMYLRSLTDAAGNVSQGEAEVLQEGTQVLVFDNIPPQLAITTEAPQRYEQPKFDENMTMTERGVKYYRATENAETGELDTVDITLAFDDAYVGAALNNLELTFYEDGQPSNRLLNGYDYVCELNPETNQYVVTIHLPYVKGQEKEYRIETSFADLAGNQTELVAGNEDQFWSCTTTEGKKGKKTYSSGYFVLDNSKPTLNNFYLEVDNAQMNGHTTIIPEGVDTLNIRFNLSDPGEYWSSDWFRQNVRIELHDFNTDDVIKSYTSDEIMKLNEFGDYKVQYNVEGIETASMYLTIEYKDKANNVLVLGNGTIQGEMVDEVFVSYPFIIDHEIPELDVYYPAVPENSYRNDKQYKYYNDEIAWGYEQVFVTLKEATYLNNVDDQGNVVKPEITVLRRSTPDGTFEAVNDENFEIRFANYDGANTSITATVILPYDTDENGNEYEYKFIVEYTDAAGNNVVLSDEFKNREKALGWEEFVNNCSNGRYEGGILVLDNKSPMLLECDFDGTFREGSRVLERNEEDQAVNVMVRIDDPYFKLSRAKARLVREGVQGEDVNLYNVGHGNQNGVEYIKLTFNYAQFGTGVYHIEFSYDDKATNPLVKAANASSEVGLGSWDGKKYVSKSFIMDKDDPIVKISYNKAYRQIKDGAADLMSKVPTTGYDAYYGAEQEMIQMTVEITEHFADEILDEEDKLIGLEDFVCENLLGKEIAESFEWTKQEGATDADPDVYVGTLMVQTEGIYEFGVSYSDMASNDFELDEDTEGNALGGTNVSEDGEYQSITMILDTTSPVIKGTYLDKDKKDITADYVYDHEYSNGEHRYYYNNEVAEGGLSLHLEVTDENIRYSELYSGYKEYDALEQWRAFTLADNGDEVAFTDETVKAAVEALKDNKNISNDKIEIDLRIAQQANYSFPIGMEDLAGNLATLEKATPEKMHVTYDSEDPEFTTTWAFNSPQDSGVFDKIHYTENGYIFSSKPLRIVTTARDTVSGIYSIEYEVTYLAASGQFVTITYVDEPKLRYENDDPTALTVYDEVLIPIYASSFKGTVKTTVVDFATNDIDVSRDHIVEDNATFASQSGININTTTQPSRITNGMTFYNTDVLFNITVKEDFSGIRTYSYKAGGQAVHSADFSSGLTGEGSTDMTQPDNFEAVGTGDGIITSLTLPDTLVASVNNSNGVEVSATFTSNTGYVRSTSATYNIDVTAPTITVTYDNNNPAHDVYYKDPRVATVVITERNFDKNDVEFTITNQHGTMPRITDWVSAGSGDAMTHTCQVIFDQDGDYTFTLSFMDMAGNRAQYDRVDEFTIDRTVPTYTVTYDNNNSKNGFYFDAKRTATIEIIEHNFDPNLIRISVTKDGRAFNPSYTWRRNGDHAVAVIEYLEDADYTFTIDGMDLANNELALYTRDRFVIDTKNPEVEITNVEDRSANNGEVKPIVKYSDTNLDKNKVDILLSGAHNGATDLPSTITATDNGAELVFSDFERVPGMDDIYSLSVTVYDLAGNHSEASIMFSVNRFGSVYTVDDWLQQLLDDVYTNNITSDVSITETNVDTLLESSISLNVDGDLRPLNAGTDYIVHESGSDVSWKQYTYQILASNFAQEGHYIIMISSKDRARNSSDNASKDKAIEFVVDKSSPSVVVSGVEHNGRYRENSRNVTVDVRDSAPLTMVSVILNGNKVDFDASALMNNDGKIDFVIDAANSMQTMSVIARDAAGNEFKFPMDDKDYAENLEEIRFLITANILVQFFMNRPLFIGSMIGLVAVIGGLFFFIFGAKKRKKEDRRRQIDNM